MRLNLNIAREIKIAIALVLLFVLISFSESQNKDVVCKHIIVKLENTNENHFLDEKDIIHLLSKENEALIGASLSKISLRELERRLSADKTIRNSEIFADLKGNLAVKVELRRPIARILNNEGPDAYITEDGAIMPVSDKFTSRVILISGAYTRQLLKQENLNKEAEGKQLMELLKYINRDKFWKAQIAQLDINRQFDVTMFPQVSKQTVMFGVPENIEEKFTKLKVFYKEILPASGWNKYEKVNLKYLNQIVAE